MKINSVFMLFTVLLYSTDTVFAAPSHEFTLVNIESKYLYDEQEWFEIELDVKNAGNESALTGAITVSFPDYTFNISDSEQSNWIQNIDTSPSGSFEIRSAGGSLGLFQAGTCEASPASENEYLMAEYYTATNTDGSNQWKPDETRRLSFRVKLDHSIMRDKGLRIQLRSTFTDYLERACNPKIENSYFNDRPPSNFIPGVSAGNRIDQQDYQVKIFTIRDAQPEPEFSLVGFPSTVRRGEIVRFSAEVYNEEDYELGDSVYLAQRGSISFSFPQYTDLINPVSNFGTDLGDVYVTKKGDNIYLKEQCSPDVADYLLVESYLETSDKSESWLPGQKREVFFDINVKEDIGEYLLVNIRSTMQGLNECNSTTQTSRPSSSFFDGMETSSSEDQQNYRVRQIKIPVIQDVPTPSIELSVLSSSVRPDGTLLVSATMTNQGDTGYEGSISVSFPDYRDVDDKDLVSGLGQDEFTHVKGDLLFPIDKCAESEREPAEYLLVEHYISIWEPQETRTLEFEIAPKAGLDELRLNVRGTLKGSGDCGETYNALPNLAGGNNATDQQGYTVRQYSIDVEEIAPAPSIELSALSSSVRSDGTLMVSATMTNQGDTGYEGSISVSFPDYRDVDDKDLVSGLGQDEFTRVKGDLVFPVDKCAQSEREPAEYLLVEHYVGIWEPQETRTLEFEVAPKAGLDELRLNVRGTLKGSGDCGKTYNALPSLSGGINTTDQQGYAVRQYIVEVEQFLPNPSFEVVTFPDSLIAGEDQIIEITLKNDGGFATNGSITLGLPDFTERVSAADAENLLADAGTSTTNTGQSGFFRFYPGDGELIYLRGKCSPSPQTQYLFAEFYMDDWEAEQSKTLRVKIKVPRDEANLNLYIRGTMASSPCDGAPENTVLPNTTIVLDQQGYNASFIQIPISAPEVNVDVAQINSGDLEVNLEPLSTGDYPVTVQVFVNGISLAEVIFQAGQSTQTISFEELQNVIDESGNYQIDANVIFSDSDETGGFSIGDRTLNDSRDSDEGKNVRPKDNGQESHPDDDVEKRNQEDPMYSVPVEDPVNIAFGNYYYQKSLITMPSRGGAITFEIGYDTLRSQQRATMGNGWRHNWEIFLHELSTNLIQYDVGNGKSYYFEFEGLDDDGNELFTERLDELDARLVKLDSGDFFLTLGDSSTIYFAKSIVTGEDKRYDFVQLTEPNGRRVEATQRDLRGIRQLKTNWSDFELNFDYTESNLLSMVSGPEGQIYEFVYDENLDLTQYRDPHHTVDDSHGIHRFTYIDSLMIEAFDPDGKRFLFNKFDAEGRVIEQLDAEGSLSTFEYIDISETKTRIVTDRMGHAITYVHDQNHRLIRQYQTVSQNDEKTQLVEIEYRWDDENNLISTIDANGTVTNFVYDERGNKRFEIGPFGTTEWQYDDNNNVVYRQDRDGAEWHFEYDVANNLISQTDPLNRVTQFTYDNYGQLIKQTDANGFSTIFGFDEYGRRTCLRDAEAAVENGEDCDEADWNWSFDDAGRVVSKSSPVGNTTTWNYTLGGWIDSVTAADGGVVSWDYNLSGKATSVTDQEENVITLFRDQNERIREITFPSERQILRTYDLNDRLISETQPGERQTQTVFDELGRPLITKRVAGETTYSRYYTYDANGNVISETDALGNTTLHEYDKANRRIKTTDPLGGSVHYYYDAMDRLEEVIDQDGKRVFKRTYDIAGQLEEEVNGNGDVTRFVYDDNGNIRYRKQYPNEEFEQVIEYKYDANNQLIETIDQEGGVSTQEYDDAGRKISQTDPEGTITLFAYDAMDRVSAINDGEGNIQQYEYNTRGLLAEFENARGGFGIV